MKSTNKNVLVVGTGTIGEPLIGLLTRLRSDLGLGKVIFHKRTPLKHEKPKVNSLLSSGALLSVNEGSTNEFEAMGHSVSYTLEEAIKDASVIIDCTPAGNVNKDILYKNFPGKTFIAQGSENGFGVPYALGISDERLIGENPSYIQVVSCNTHAIARLLSVMSRNLVPRTMYADFTCIRRSNDVSQVAGFQPSVTCGRHDDDIFGTHHARDVNNLFNYKVDLPIFSSAIKTNTQYMHTIRFSITLDELVDLDTVVKRLKNDKFVSLTHKKSTNKVFSFGRDHGFYGRIYTQAVVCVPSLYVRNYGDVTRVAGVSFTPQDGNSLMSSMSACLYGIYGEDYQKKMNVLEEMLVNEV